MGYIKNGSSSEQELVAAGVRIVLSGGKGMEVPALAPYECGVLERSDWCELSGRFDLIQWMGEIATKIGEKGFRAQPSDSLDVQESVKITKVEDDGDDEAISPPEHLDEDIIPEKIMPEEFIVEEIILKNGPEPNEDAGDKTLPEPEWVACMSLDDPTEALKEFSGAELKHFCDDVNLPDYGNKTEMATRLMVWFVENTDK